MKTRIGFAVALLVVLWGSTASAEPLDDASKEAVRSLSNQAASEYEQGQYPSAREKFQRAYGIAKVPKLAVWIARTEEKLGHWVSAYELYRQALTLEPNELWKGRVQQDAQKDAQTQLDKLKPRIPRITISVEGAKPDEITLAIDDVAVPSGLIGIERMVDPGQRKLVGRRGTETVEQTANLSEGEVRNVILTFRKDPSSASFPATPSPTSAQPTASTLGTGGPPNPSPPVSTPGALAPGNATALLDLDTKARRQRTIGWIGVGVGTAGLALGATTGILVALKYGDLNSDCPDRTCKPENQSKVDTYQSLRTVSTVALISGAAVAAGGVALVMTSTRSHSPSATLVVSPGSLQVQGKF